MIVDNTGSIKREVSILPIKASYVNFKYMGSIRPLLGFAIIFALFSSQLVLSHPLPAFTYTPPNPSVGFNVTFESKSGCSGCTITRYNWSFGDGTGNVSGASLSKINHTFSITGSYRVTLNLQGSDGHWNSTAMNVAVSSNRPPVAVFDYSPKRPLVGTAIRFDANGSSDPDGAGDIAVYNWSFGDGTSQSNAYPWTAHNYSANGTYNAGLTVADIAGLKSSISKEIRVYPITNTPPIALFSFSPDGPSVNDAVTFNASGSYDPDGRIVEYWWIFPENSNLTKTAEPSVRHIYGQRGIYEVILIVYDNFFNFSDPDPTNKYSGWNSTSRSVDVRGNSPPVISFTFQPLGAAVGETVAFDAGGSYDPDGDRIVRYHWDFGDDKNASSDSHTATHQFDRAGTYNVSLTATDERGASAEYASPVPVQVYDPKCVDNDGGINPPVRGMVYGTDVRGQLLDTCMDTRFLTEQHCSNNRNASTKIDCNGQGNDMICTEGRCRRRTVAPTADFTYIPARPNAGDSIFFDASSSYASDPDFPLISYEWDFGDEMQGEGRTATHFYAIPGRYTVTLTVMDALGSSGSASDEVVAMPVVSLNVTDKAANSTRMHANFSISFPRGTGRLSVDSAYLDFGDRSGIAEVCGIEFSCTSANIGRKMQHAYNITNATRTFVAQAWVRFSDLSFASAKAAISSCTDSDGDGYCNSEDCDDSNPASYPFAPEKCDGKDNDCDGRADENFVLPGKIFGSACNDWTGSVCRGVWACSADGSDVVCKGSVSMGQLKEVCANRLDDDCDGKIDETDELDPSNPEWPLPGCIVCMDGREELLPPVAGECGIRKKVCVKGEWVTEGGYRGSQEVCNSRDDDCNRIVDDIGGAKGKLEAACQCFNGGMPQPEICDGIDNDCNSQADEIADCCMEGERRSLGGKDVGACRKGEQVCEKGAWTTISQPVGPQEEMCRNEIDDDCDGEVDENCPVEGCSNGIKNGDEGGVDCGGSCPEKCAEVTANTGVLMLAVAALIVVVIGGALQFFGKI